jgi:N-methylhydantoinase A
MDPRDFVLVAFGGAGPLHAAFVARALGVKGVLVPCSPGVLCAMGVLAKDMQMDFSQTRLLREDVINLCDEVQAIYSELEQRARSAFERNGDDPSNLRTERVADARYVGQNHELTVAVPLGIISAATLAVVKESFNQAHQEMYGYAAPDKKIELVTMRLRAWIPIDKLDLARVALPARAAPLAAANTRQVYFEETAGFVDCLVYERHDLRPGDRLSGPAVVEQMDATTVVPPGFLAEVDDALNLFLTQSA